MELVVALVSRLLSWLRWSVVPGTCPGGWTWATAACGAVFACLPLAGAVVVALVRRWTGNAYSPRTVVPFAAVGVVFGAVLPLAAFTAVARLYEQAAAGTVPAGLRSADVASMGNSHCVLPPELDYLGTPTALLDEVTNTAAPLRLAAYGATLVLPLLSLLVVRVQAVLAFRRGPLWPARLLWLPFAVFAVLSTWLSANTAALLWLGFLPAALVGCVLVRLVGAPRLGVLHPEPRPEAPPRVPPSRPARSRTAVQPAPAAERPLTAAEPPLTAAAPPMVTQRHPPSEQPPDVPAGAGGHRFRRIRRLGHGGFGSVWLAMDDQLGRMVAVKIANTDDEVSVQRTLREARALAAVNHPNCVHVYDVVDDETGLAIVMEYIRGQGLSDLVTTGGPLTDVAAARLWTTLAGALAAAHEQGVLHRDIKPSNVIVDGSGAPHLIDFGIARAQGDVTLTSPGTMVGTPDYLAPETATGTATTPASDAWQLAATVSYALTGEPPRGRRESQMSALMAAAHAAPCTRLPGRSAHRGLLLAALDADPAARPGLALVQEELQRWLARGHLAATGPVTEQVSR
ncbi:protein kinase [Saccharopolyspora erythraea]|uniref:serine/threonine-protein kinase n=1 Tax=Saccharopolyspora erythraea TaxID=1836 RepID=UPI001BA9F690|nr:serine/threonine-protein kinase [Saccharopolyspora erythraea]QUH02525.1 protein kinase [Saccharopolyspora erythraea]